jgi:hypothetical protein
VEASPLVSAAARFAWLSRGRTPEESAARSCNEYGPQLPRHAQAYALDRGPGRRAFGLEFELCPWEAAEFDAHTPRWFASADGRPVEFLSPFGQQGERIHVRAAQALIAEAPVVVSLNTSGAWHLPGRTCFPVSKDGSYSYSRSNIAFTEKEPSG